MLVFDLIQLSLLFWLGLPMACPLDPYNHAKLRIWVVPGLCQKFRPYWSHWDRRGWVYLGSYECKEDIEVLSAKHFFRGMWEFSFFINLKQVLWKQRDWPVIRCPRCGQLETTITPITLRSIGFYKKTRIIPRTRTVKESQVHLFRYSCSNNYKSSPPVL